MWKFFEKYPGAAFFFGCLSLGDAINCIINGHADWWVPALAAICFGSMIQQKEKS